MIVRSVYAVFKRGKVYHKIWTFFFFWFKKIHIRFKIFIIKKFINNELVSPLLFEQEHLIKSVVNFRKKKKKILRKKKIQDL